jgi:hypothetical protein
MKSYVKWKLNPQYIPLDPKERSGLWLKMLDMIKDDLKSGNLTKWGTTYDGSEGYAFSKLGVKELYTMLMKWSPYVEFDVKPVLNVDEVIESIKSLAG